MDSTTRLARAEEEILADMIHVGRFSAHLLGRPLRRYQYEVAAAVVTSVLLNQGRTFAVMMSRQAGKNETSAHIEAFLLNYFRRKGGNIVKVSPTFKPQTINSLLRLASLYEGSALPGADPQHGYMLAVGRARCSFYSGAPGANVVGATADLLLEADEAQDLDAVKWNKEFRPMGASTNVTSVLWGTAWTRDTLLANTIRALRAEEARDGHRRVFTVPWQEVAREVPAYGAYVRGEIARLGPDHPLVRTQYALEELDSRGGMFAPGVRAMMRGAHPRRRTPLDRLAAHILTIDVGGAAEEQAPGSLLLDAPTRHDATALTVFRVEYGAGGLPRYLVQDRYHWTGQPHHALLPTIVRLAELWAAEQVILDATGLGQGLASFLETHLGERLTPFVFTSASKSTLGWDFLALCASGRFLDHAPDGSPEQAQFWREVDAADYSVVPGVARRMRWGVADPRTHDDLLVSAALVAAARTAAPPADPAVIEADDPLFQRAWSPSLGLDRREGAESTLDTDPREHPGDLCRDAGRGPP